MGRAGFEINDYKDVARDGNLQWSVDNSYLNAPAYGAVAFINVSTVSLVIFVPSVTMATYNLRSRKACTKY